MWWVGIFGAVILVLTSLLAMRSAKGYGLICWGGGGLLVVFGSLALSFPLGLVWWQSVGAALGGFYGMFVVTLLLWLIGGKLLFGKDYAIDKGL